MLSIVVLYTSCLTSLIYNHAAADFRLSKQWISDKIPIVQCLQEGRKVLFFLAGHRNANTSVRLPEHRVKGFGVDHAVTIMLQYPIQGQETPVVHIGCGILPVAQAGHLEFVPILRVEVTESRPMSFTRL